VVTATQAPADPTAEAVVAPRWAGALVGLVAAACGLGAAELLVGIATGLRSPVISVGDRVVDNVPTAVKDWVIDVFGTADKAVLLGGVLVLLAAAAAGIGVLAVRRGLGAGLVGVAVFALVGALASVGRGGDGVGAVVPSLVAGGVAAVALTVLTRQVAAGWPRIGALADDDMPTRRIDQGVDSRRRFLGTAAAMGAGAGVAVASGRWLRQRGVAAAERLATVLPRAVRPLGPVPAGADLGVPGAVPFITPNADFFRIDTALSIPQVDPRSWSLTVSGRVDRPLTITYEELLDRPMVEADITLSCVSNEVGGSLVGNARWLGCRLDELLEEAGIDPSADQVVGRSVDGFTAGFPTALLDGRDALVAIGMNGEPLPIRHGYPARLVVPGVYGYVSATKWLSEIELTRFDEFEGYWIPRGWAAEGPIKTQSRIDTPTSGKILTAGEKVVIAGVAWAPTRGIERVEVQVDDEPWEDARLGEQYADTTWRQWSLDWTPTDVRYHQLRVRATDGTGETQTEERTQMAPDGASGWHTFRINVR
jgi:DMSO/TMAO reductase YedYZ molybdopterin-dependent catalytic subunit